MSSLVAGWRSKLSADASQHHDLTIAQPSLAPVARVSPDSPPSNPHRRPRIPDALGFLRLSQLPGAPGRRSTRACSKDRKFALVVLDHRAGATTTLCVPVRCSFVLPSDHTGIPYYSARLPSPSLAQLAISSISPPSNRRLSRLLYALSPSRHLVLSYQRFPPLFSPRRSQ